MTEELFRQDSYLQSCTARVVGIDAAGAILLDRTVFYPTGGGQPGDRGRLVRADGVTVVVADTRKGAAPGEIIHVPAADQPALAVGDEVKAELDWERRHRHMRMHTALHVLCAVVPYGVTGGQVGDQRSRLDFDIGDGALDKDQIHAKLNELIASGKPAAARWITDDELAAQPDLVRTMSVKPPSGAGKVRLIDIDGIDLQPCGGTHVASLQEIGPVVIEKIENKGKRNRRVVVALATP
jgi:misacylated tRNA(Ala) deacylase